MTVVSSADAKHGVTPVTPLPPRRRRQPREHATYIHGARPPEPPVCWLAQYADDACAGQLEHCHLIEQQVLRREGLQRFLGDHAVWVPGCRHHHFSLDNFRGVLVARTDLPAVTETFAERFGLGWYLDRRFGA